MTTGDRSEQLRTVLQALEGGNCAPAERVGRRLVELRQDDADAQILLGFALGARGDAVQAAAWLDRAARARPLRAHPGCDLAALLLRLGRPQSVAPQFRACLELAPDDIRLRFGFAEFQRDVGASPDEAITLLAPVLLACPDSARAHFAMGLALVEAGRFTAAAERFRRTIALDPAPALAWANLGMALEVECQFDAALAAYDAALARTPDSRQIRTNRAVALLHAGRMAEAWQDPDWRFAPPGNDLVSLPSDRLLPPLSRMPDLTGRVVLVMQDEGLGDTLQFLRYLPLLAARGAHVIVAVPPELARVLRTVPGVAAVPDHGAPVPDYDFHCSFNNLPRAFETTLATVPADIPYIAPDPALAAYWARRLPPDGALRVGLVWAGAARPWQPGTTNLERRRSTSLAVLAPLAAVRGVRFVSLQKGPASHEVQTLGDLFDLFDPMQEVHDFADTAGIVANLDLLISVDTSVVHLAGAMGKPVFLLDRYDNCWRWLSGREDSPWYPGLRIFRQQRSGEWAPVVARVAAALAEAVAGVRSASGGGGGPRLDAGPARQHIPCMSDPFVQPEEPTAAAAIEAISEDLSLFDDWMERYEFIIGMGRKLPPFPDAWANDAHRVPGCQSRVWMEAILRDGRLYFAGLSDAAIVSGLVALLLRVYSGRSPDEILATDPVFLKDLGLLEALSTNRGNGIAAMARKVREVAAMQRAG